jgi:hypothetical protein
MALPQASLVRTAERPDRESSGASIEASNEASPGHLEALGRDERALPGLDPALDWADLERLS